MTVIRRRWAGPAVLLSLLVAGCTTPTTLEHIADEPTTAAPAPVETSPAPELRSEPAVARVMPNDGEGIMSITARTCGTSRSWVAQAAANGISPPAWIVPLSPVTVDCSLTPVAAPAEPSPAVQAAGWVHPTDVGDCIVPNGSREFGTWRGDHYHGGIDMGAPAHVYSGDPIHAVHSGIAHHGYEAGGAGIYVWIDHHDGTSSWYFHMASRAIGDDTPVSAGQVIGYVGISGDATAYHLHLEIKVSGGRVDPVPFLAARGVQVGC